jgi:hypothetical protein
MTLRLLLLLLLLLLLRLLLRLLLLRLRLQATVARWPPLNVKAYSFVGKHLSSWAQYLVFRRDNKVQPDYRCELGRGGGGGRAVAIRG